MLSNTVNSVPEKPKRSATVDERELRIATIAASGTTVSVVSNGKAADSDQRVIWLFIIASKCN
jgi:hypothetical protein